MDVVQAEETLDAFTQGMPGVDQHVSLQPAVDAVQQDERDDEQAGQQGADAQEGEDGSAFGPLGVVFTGWWTGVQYSFRPSVENRSGAQQVRSWMTRCPSAQIDS